MLAWVLTAALADPIDGGATVTLRAGLRTWGNEHGRPVVVVAADPRVTPLLEALRTNTPGLDLRPPTDPAAATGCVVTVTGPVGELWTLRGSAGCPGVVLAGLPRPPAPYLPTVVPGAPPPRSYELPIALTASLVTTVLVGAPWFDDDPVHAALYGLPSGWLAGSVAVTAAAPGFARPVAWFGALGSVALVAGSGFLAVAATQSPGVLNAFLVSSVAAPAVGGHLLVRHARRLRQDRAAPVVGSASSAAAWVYDACHLEVEGVEAGGGRIAVRPGAIPADEVEACLAAWDGQDGVLNWTSASVGADGVVWTQAP